MEMALDTGNCIALSDSCNNMQCSNTNEHLIKEVYAVYAHAFTPKGFVLSSADSSTLLPIAVMDPAVAGTAVYTARAMLDMNQDYFSGNVQRAVVQDDLNTEKPDSSMAVLVYPNPASDLLYVEMISNSEKVSTKLSVEILELEGRLVLQQNVKSGYPINSISTAELPQGVYLVRVSDESGLKYQERLVIVR
jgi:hypothetical protein